MLMREIKFRAWDRKEKRMRSVDELWNLWSQYSDEDEKKNPGLKTTPYVTVINQSYRGDDLKLVVDKDCDLMQFTGLLDKNGKEIYEGDIIEYEFSAGFDGTHRDEVVFRDGKFLPMVADEEYSEVEIIGNIYENPELLTTK